MHRCKRLFVLLVFLAVPSLCAGQFEGFEKVLYKKYLTPVTSFGYISVTRYHSGRDKREEEGFDIWEIDEEISSFLRLRFKNNFANIPYKFSEAFEWNENPKIGHLQCQIWLHGDSYPIAYHVECMLGAGKKSRVLTDATLGITSKDEANKAIKEALDRLVSKFALTFFRARGEL